MMDEYDVKRRVLPLLLVTVSVCVASFGQATEDEATKACCQSTLRNTDCEILCDQLSEIQGGRVHLLTTVANQCPDSLVALWQCMESSTAAAIVLDDNSGLVAAGGDYWPGRACCDLPLSSQCKNSCKRATSIGDLENNCHQDELAFFNCLNREESSSQCCGQATSNQCRAICKTVFLQELVTTQTQQAVQNHCTAEVFTCLNDYILSQPARNPLSSLPCCNLGSSDRCVERCRRTLRLQIEDQDKLVEELEKDCGSPSFTEPLWQCFLLDANNNIRRQNAHKGTVELTGVDGAKLQCCLRANTKHCRDLCMRTFGASWTDNWHVFDVECGQSAHEQHMKQCLADVEAPCRLGCSGLSFCSNFNYRPTEMFRSCSAEADKGAERDYTQWTRGLISLPHIMETIPVRDIRRCQPSMWKAIACTMHIKPCYSDPTITKLCRSDCLKLLSECLDKSRTMSATVVEDMCQLVAVDEHTQPCMSLAPYLGESTVKTTAIEVTNPCQPNPCDHGQVCQVNRQKCSDSSRCKPFICRAGCRVGDMSAVVVSVESYLRLPAPGEDRCYHVCRCGHHRLLQRCTYFGCLQDDCVLSSDRIQPHGSHFDVHCQRCVCQHGEVTCRHVPCTSLASRKNSASASRKQSASSGLPCGCEKTYAPVCSREGRTYPNACNSRCLGIQESAVAIGACNSLDPCASNPCVGSEICVPRRQTCLAVNHRPCLQYRCVSKTAECSLLHSEPVCTTEDVDVSLCKLVSRGLQLAYWGQCMTGCRTEGEVCGMDGDTYASECAARSRGVLVDYWAPCQALGASSYVDVDSPSCQDVTCHSVHLSHRAQCQPVRPPGACCPVCGGVIQMMFSRHLVTRVAEAMKASMVTVQNVTSFLRQFVMVSECTIGSSLAIDGTLVVTITASSLRPTALQASACIEEAKRITHLLATQSPIMTSYLLTLPFVNVTAQFASVRLVPAAVTSLAAPVHISQLSAALTIVHVLTLLACTCTRFWPK